MEMSIKCNTFHASCKRKTAGSRKKKEKNFRTGKKAEKDAPHRRFPLEDCRFQM